MELIEELQLKNNHLDVALKQLRANGTKLAECEKEYKEAVSKEALKLRDEGVPVTLIDKIIYGMPTISTLRFNRDCAEVVYQANQEAINITKLQVRLIEAQLQREWGAIQ